MEHSTGNGVLPLVPDPPVRTPPPLLLHRRHHASQLDAKSKKLKKVYGRLMRCEQEIADLSGEFQLEREDLLDMVRDLHRQLQLKSLVIMSFVPAEDVEKVCSARARVRAACVLGGSLCCCEVQ